MFDEAIGFINQLGVDLTAFITSILQAGGNVANVSFGFLMLACAGAVIMFGIGRVWPNLHPVFTDFPQGFAVSACVMFLISGMIMLLLNTELQEVIASGQFGGF